MAERYARGMGTGDRFYEDKSVKRHSSRRHLTTASDRNGEQVRSKVGVMSQEVV